MEIGTFVKVNIPYKNGEKRKGKKYKKGKIIKEYKNFVLLEIETKSGVTYKECFKSSEIII